MEKERFFDIFESVSNVMAGISIPVILGLIMLYLKVEPVIFVGVYVIFAMVFLVRKNAKARENRLWFKKKRRKSYYAVIRKHM